MRERCEAAAVELKLDRDEIFSEAALE